MWIIGDSFVASSFRKYFKKVPIERLFTKQYYEVTAFCSSRQSDANNNTLSRILNSLAHAINKNTKLPKYIVVVIESDLIDFLRYGDFGISSIYGTWIEYLAKEMNDMIHARYQSLPRKAKKIDEPFLYWLAYQHTFHSETISNGLNLMCA